jgi:membrane-bound lytic murein transglycosylase A
MVAQDTGSAITGPARADIYYGAGAEAGRISGRFRHSMRFVMLVPKSLDPVARGRKMPVPEPRPSEKIAKLFPPVDPLKDQAKNQKSGAKSSDAAAGPNTTNATSAAESSKGAAAVTGRVPLPQARPAIKPSRDSYRHRVRHDWYSQ